MDQTPPPGFYADPEGTQRWWDGRQWTSHTRPPAGQPAGQPSVRPGVGQASPPPGRRKLPWIIGGIVALLVAGGGITAAVLVAGGSGDSGDAGDKQSEVAGPEDTVRTYFDALAVDDCEGMVEQVTERAAQEPSMDCATYDRDSMDGVDASNEIIETEEDGDEATVHSRETFEHPGGTLVGDCTYELVRQDDVWLIDDADCDTTTE